ncbi:hypothetical protein [Rhizobium laguerreae]|nr:hypothetical protein [Rhizobium laguerreae]MBY3314707.1 hypothetical protein [Rhizobium laguerreae]
MIIEIDLLRWGIIIGAGAIGGPIFTRYLWPGLALLFDDTQRGLARLLFK